MRIVLASASPRRKALLEALGLRVEVVVSNVPEIADGPPADAVVVNARAKRDDVAARIEGGALVIGADTLVVIGDHVLGKPVDRAEAREMLSLLAGKTHQVLTGVAVADTGRGRVAEDLERTDVTFRDLSSGEIDRFIDVVNPLDRAGAYTVDGPGSLLVARYRGCYQNVLGLPVVRLDCVLRQIGFRLFDAMDGAGAVFL